MHFAAANVDVAYHTRIEHENRLYLFCGQVWRPSTKTRRKGRMNSLVQMTTRLAQSICASLNELCEFGVSIDVA